MRPRRDEIIAGLFFVIALVAFMLFLSVIGGGFKRWFAKKKPAVTYFHNIGGLKSKEQVTYQGWRVGDIEDISFDPTRNLIRVDLSLDEGFEIPKGRRALAMITTASLLGDPYIEITSDIDYVDTNMLVLKHGSYRLDEKGILEFDAFDPSSWGMLLVQGDMMLKDIRKLTKNFGAYGDTIGRILVSGEELVDGARDLISDTDFRMNVHGFAAKAHRASLDLSPLMSDARGLMRRASSVAERIDTIVASDTVKSLIDNADETMLNVRVLSYGLAESPSRLVWADKKWEKRVAERDPAILSASMKKAAPGADTGAKASAPAPSYADETPQDERPNRTGYR